MFDGGVVTVDTNGSIGTTNQKAHISLKSLHVQDKGTFQMKTYTPQNQFTMVATNLTVSQIERKVLKIHSFFTHCCYTGIWNFKNSRYGTWGHTVFDDMTIFTFIVSMINNFQIPRPII